MKQLLTLLLVAFVPTGLCGSSKDSKNTMSENTRYDDLSVKYKLAVDVIEKKTQELKSKDLTERQRCFAQMDLEHSLLTVVMARNKDMTFRVLSPEGAGLQIQMPSTWYIPWGAIRRQRLMCIFSSYAKRIVDQNGLRPMLFN